MKKEEALELWQDRLAGELSEADEKALEVFLSEHPGIAAEWKDLEHTWQLFEEIERPEPSLEMDARFEGMMAAYRAAKKHRVSVVDSLFAWVARSWQVGLACLVLGLFIGWWMLPTQDQNMNQLSSEIQEMKKLMMLTLIEQPKAQERIRAVNMATELSSADERIIEALISTLNHDDNLNVRVAALESLLYYSTESKVRHALIEALKAQESPIMQIAISDALVTIQERSSVEAMEKLREAVDDEMVKDKLEENIKTLISI